YREDWKKFADALIAAVPNIKFCGPSVHNNGEWARRFMENFGQSNHVVLITEHLYPGGAGGKVPSRKSAAPACSPAVRRIVFPGSIKSFTTFLFRWPFPMACPIGWKKKTI